MRAAVGQAFLLTVLAFSGCLEPSAPAETAPPPVLVTDPREGRDRSDENGDHLHDYWDGRTTLTLIDHVQEAGTLWFGNPIPVAVFRPDDNHVVPLGTRWVNVTVAWQVTTTSLYRNPQLWVKTAADDAPRLVADVASGDTVTVEATNDQNDLPHQLLSAWRFELVAARPEGNVLPLRFEGEVRMRVDLTRGLDIPLFPGHPDHWKNATQIELLQDGNGIPLYQGPAGDGNCFGGCLRVHVPRNGTIVPPGTLTVEVVVEFATPTVTTLRLTYHPADSRRWQDVTAAESTPSKRVYRIPVDAFNADGPYALQSLWEFRLVPENSLALYHGAYEIRATAHRA
jgi:hypothetical protein